MMKHGSGTMTFAMGLLGILGLVCLTLTAGALAQTSSGLNSVEGVSIMGTGTTDTLWADSTVHRWSLYNNTNGSLLLAVWPCGGSSGCLTYSGSSAVSTVYPETALPIGSTDSFLQVSSSSLPAWSNPIPNCAGTGSNLNYNTSTHAFNCSNGGLMICANVTAVTASAATTSAQNLQSCM